jgi:DNA modification methylase
VGEIILGDCLDVMKSLPDNHFGGIVTDPPYGIGFMNKGRDREVPGKDYWRLCKTMLKPGGYLLAMGGSRTFRRLACEIEDGGFEIRDTIAWLYGSGFPKSHNHFGPDGFGTALKPAYEPIIMASQAAEQMMFA